ncbi:hypothetical protein [Streptococcus mutans]|uniref:hypothetical protein n=1 Tax=Streptococcus mutans TaxID=1309 RepID=UPI0002B5A859|nr:hypothetical protein [Streptococcus mutans]RKW06312.1 MAG: hypothetical protein D8H99_04975 [Streptococcus sp.]ARS62689.1 hypothetical protein RO10_05555 [Streptococcus mutans]EMB89612.1 hypothetical protein SMU58_08955 [Streptococcus mutans A19]EMC18849.1 hypothetical protein SMU77_02834 [Streptococcus mutans NV1996]KZM63902.1 hypothetical protein AWN62_00735 [Streptococcus mutans]
MLIPSQFCGGGTAELKSQFHYDLPIFIPLFVVFVMGKFTISIMELLSSPKRSYDFIVRLNGLSLFDMQNIGIFNNN